MKGNITLLLALGILLSLSANSKSLIHESACNPDFSISSVMKDANEYDHNCERWPDNDDVFIAGGGIVADFVGSPTVWQAPASVTFTDVSVSSNPIQTWTWTFDIASSGTVSCAGCTGANATYIGQNPPQVNYPNPGLYSVSLTISDGVGSDTEFKIDHIEVNAPSGDCDTLATQWENIGPTVTTYGFGGGYISGIPDPVHMVLPTDMKGVYEWHFTPNPGSTQVGAARIELGNLYDPNDDTRFQVVVYDDDGTGAPGAQIGIQGDISPTQLGVPTFGQFDTFWIPFDNPPVPTTGVFHVGVEIFAGDAADTLVVATSCQGPPECPIAEGETDASNNILTSGFGYQNFYFDFGFDFDVHIIPMLGEWAPEPVLQGISETVVCDTTFVTISDSMLYSFPSGSTYIFADGTVLNSSSYLPTIERVYTSSGPDTLSIYTVNDCGRSDTAIWEIPYTFESAANSISVARCYEYTVPSGNATYYTTGVYQDTIPNATGCDSIITIDLFIGETPTITHFTGRGEDQFRVRWEYPHPVTVNDTNFRIRAWESGFPLAFTDKSQFPGNFQKKFTGLDDNTWYKTKVGFACDDGSFIWGAIDSVRTKKIPCPEVAGLTQQLPLAEHTATLSWNDNGADSYKLRFYPQSGGSYSFRTVTDTNKTLAGLSPNTQYEIQVKAQCSNGLESSYGEPYTFSTSEPAPRLSSPIIGNDLRLYPNPTTGFLNLYLSASNGGNVWAHLIDVTGRTVRSESLKSGGIQSIDLSSLKNGLYTIRVVDGASISTHKVVKE